jgi:hypothetical protein
MGRLGMPLSADTLIRRVKGAAQWSALPLVIRWHEGKPNRQATWPMSTARRQMNPSRRAAGCSRARECPNRSETIYVSVGRRACRATQSGGGGADATWFRLGEPQRSRSRPES